MPAQAPAALALSAGCRLTWHETAPCLPQPENWPERHPYPDRVQEHVSAHGTHAFYESVELRKECCAIRKVEPLRRALQGRSAWITGQRREQPRFHAE